MISNELLSEVFIGTIYEENEPFTEIKFDDEVNEVLFYTDCEYWNSINIYELANMCKEWALKKDLCLFSGNVNNNDNNYDLEWSFDCQIFSHKQGIELFYIKADTEPEAIFKACEWILKNV